MGGMKMKFATNQVNSYQVQTSVYSGPLDLLLELIEEAELDITSLALAQVTDQYLDHIRNLTVKQADEVSAFMVIAAKLLQIKSEALLPRPPRREEDEEDPGDELARQLLAYKRYKEIADILADRKSAGYQTYLPLSSPLEIKEQVDFGEFGVLDLWQMAQQALQQASEKKQVSKVVTRPRITIQDKIGEISRVLKLEKRVAFSRILNKAYDKVDIVISFLAVLELIRGNYIICRQEQMFEEIYLEVNDQEKINRIHIEDVELDI